jgi:hypothetical protein
MMNLKFLKKKTKEVVKEPEIVGETDFFRNVRFIKPDYISSGSCAIVTVDQLMPHYETFVVPDVSWGEIKDSPRIEDPSIEWECKYCGSANPTHEIDANGHKVHVHKCLNCGAPKIFGSRTTMIEILDKRES